MPPKLKEYDQVLSDLVSAWATDLGLEPALTSGDPLLALMESDAMQVMFLQWLAEQVLKFARASTAEGEDLDSWLADFGFLRSPPVKARGQVRFSLKSARPSNVNIPVGKVVQTQGGAIRYQTIADPIQTAWNGALGEYVIQAGQTQIIATVEALEAGLSYNVQTGQLNQIASSLPGVDLVTNLQPITNGRDAESDPAVRERFILWINSLSKNTRPAIQAAVMGVQTGVDFSLVENTDENGDPRDGYFTVVIDDGSGNPPQALLDQIADAVESVRGFTIEFAIVPAEKVEVSAELNIKVKDGADGNVVAGKVQDALVDYINSLKIGESLYVYKLIQIAFEADSNVVAVQPNSAKVDDVEDDREVNVFQVIRTEPADVSVGTYT